MYCIYMNPDKNFGQQNQFYLGHEDWRDTTEFSSWISGQVIPLSKIRRRRLDAQLQQKINKPKNFSIYKYSKTPCVMRKCPRECIRHIPHNIFWPTKYCLLILTKVTMAKGNLDIFLKIHFISLDIPVNLVILVIESSVFLIVYFQ